MEGGLYLLWTDSSSVDGLVARPRLENEMAGFRCAAHLRHREAGRTRCIGLAIEELVDERLLRNYPARLASI